MADDDDFYEDDETLEKIQSIRRREPDFVTGRHPAAGATQYLAPSATTGEWERTGAPETRGRSARMAACR